MAETTQRWQLSPQEIVERLRAQLLAAETADTTPGYFRHPEEREFYLLTAMLLDHIEGKVGATIEDEIKAAMQRFAGRDMHFHHDGRGRS
jgi:hypothetical protein